MTDVLLGVQGVPEERVPTISGVGDAFGREFGNERLGEAVDLGMGLLSPTPVGAFSTATGVSQSTIKTIDAAATGLSTIEYLNSDFPAEEKE